MTMAASYLYFIGAIVTMFQTRMHLSLWQIANGSTFAFGAFLIMTQSILQIVEEFAPQL